MEVSLAQTTDGEILMVCPTCGAEQSWSDECRRCKCDLRDLRAVWRAAHRERIACLLGLRAANFDRALEHARRHLALKPDDDAGRLLTVCHLLRADWREAYRSAPTTIDKQSVREQND